MRGEISVSPPNPPIDHHCPVVVVRGELNGLGVVRSLARAGVRAHVVDISLMRPAMWSRGVHQVQSTSLYGKGLVDTLMELADRLGTKPVLILTDEAAVVTVAEHREALKERYRSPGNSRELVEMLENKARFQDFAAGAGLPVPHGVVVSGRGQLARIGELNGPLIIKPADKMQVYLERSARLYRAASPAEAITLCVSLVDSVGELVVQQWVEGPDSNITFCLFYQGGGDDDFRGFVGRKLLASPPQVGSTAICVAAPELDAQLVTLSRDYIRKVGYRGFGSIEFKFDTRDGRPYIIEPTVGRTDWQEEIATLSGVNLPLFAYEVEAGLPRTPVTTDPIGRIAWRASFEGRSLKAADIAVRKVYDGYWRLLDPVPAMVHYAASVLRRLGPHLRRLRDRTLRLVHPPFLKSAEDVTD